MIDLVGGGGGCGWPEETHNHQKRAFVLDFGGCGVVAARKSPQLPKTSIRARFRGLWIVIVVASARESPQPPKSSVHARFRGS